jgi:hypothetical protein
MEAFSLVTAPDASIGTIQSGLDDVKDIMVRNMEKVIKRGEAIEVLVDRSEQLTTHADRFRSSSGRVTTNTIARAATLALRCADRYCGVLYRSRSVCAVPCAHTAESRDVLGAVQVADRHRSGHSADRLSDRSRCLRADILVVLTTTPPAPPPAPYMMYAHESNRTDEPARDCD